MNTIGTGTVGSSWRSKLFASTLQQVLRNALVANAVCKVENSDNFYVFNPYSSQPTAAVTAIASAGTYSVSAFTVTDDTLTASDQAAYGEHVFDFEMKMNNYDLVADRFDNMAFAVKSQIDKFVINGLCEDATGTYTTPAGGFTTAANIPTIISNLCSKVMGYNDAGNGYYLIIENTDVPGFIQAQIASGFSYADSALRNGFMTNYAGVDIYVVRSGTFVSATIGSRSDFTNSGHRVFGVKGTASYLMGTPTYDEKGVSGKLGKEVAVGTTFGFKMWTQIAGLHVDITLA